MMVLFLFEYLFMNLTRMLTYQKLVSVSVQCQHFDIWQITIVEEVHIIFFERPWIIL